MSDSDTLSIGKKFVAAMAEDDVRERPILFSGPMVRAILEGRKTQTRRIIELGDKNVMSLGQRKLGWTCNPEFARVGDVSKMVTSLVAKRTNCHSQQISVPARHPDDASIPWEQCGYERVYCRYGSPGDRLWVRETWRPCEDRNFGTCIEYRAGGKRKPEFPDDQAGWKCEQDAHSTEAHKWHSSIHMPRWASRLTLEITDVRVQRLQDISEHDAKCEGVPQNLMAATYRVGFFNFWNSIHGTNADESNPWVWAITFK